MATYFLYRVRSGEVLGVTTDPETWAGIGPRFSVTPADTPTPDGTGLSPAKIYSTGIVRNATAQEIAGFPAAAELDANEEQREQAALIFQSPDATAKLLKAVVLLATDEINLLRQWVADLKSQTALATNLANFQTRVAGLPNLNQRTNEQLRNAVLAAVAAGSAD